MRRLSFVLLLCSFVALQAWGGRAEKAYRKGDLEEAERLYREKLEDDPQDVRSLYNLGNVRYRGEDLSAAEEAYRASQLSGDPALRSDAAHNLGNVRLRAGDIDGAIASYVEALRAQPGKQDSRYNLELALRLKESTPPQQQAAQNQQGEGSDSQQNGQSQTQQEEQPQQGEQGQEPQQPQEQTQKEQGKQPQQEEGEHEQPDGGAQEENDPSDPEGNPSLAPAPEDYTTDEAERVLDGLAEEERQLQKDRMKAQGRNLRVEKDW